MDLARQFLAQHKIKPSMQRLEVMRYLLNNRNHPTADDIYNALHCNLPTLSKTTVYNTLRVLLDKGAVASINIEENVVHFDGIVKPHAHFFCVECSKIFDVPMEPTLLGHDNCPEGSLVFDTQLYHRGYCKHCLEKHIRKNKKKIKKNNTNK